MNLKGIDALIFDLGGTLYHPASDMCGLTRQFMVDSGIDESVGLSDDHIKEALVDANNWLWTHMVENNVHLHWNPSKNEWIEYGIILLKGLGIKDDVENLAERYQDKWEKFLEDVEPKLIEGVRETLQELLKRGFKLGIASNRFTDPTNALKADSIHQLFESIEYTAVPGYAKPSPYMLLQVAEDLGVNPRKCAYVGNIVEYDCVAATRAEMLPILLTWIDPNEIDKITTDVVVVNHIEEFLEILT